MNESQRDDMVRTGFISTPCDVSVNDDTPTMASVSINKSKDEMPFSEEKIIFSETPTADGVAVVGRLTISSSVVTQGNEPKEMIHQTIVKGINKLAASAFLHVCGFTRDDVCRFLYAEYEKCSSYTANLLLSLPNAEQTKLIRELKDENEKLRKKLRLQEVIKEIRSCLADCDEGGAKVKPKEMTDTQLCGLLSNPFGIDDAPKTRDVREELLRRLGEADALRKENKELRKDKGRLEIRDF